MIFNDLRRQSNLISMSHQSQITQGTKNGAYQWLSRNLQQE